MASSVRRTSVRRTSVRRTEDPAQVLSDAARFLAIDPIRHNVVLTLLHQRVADPEPGRYWIVDIGDEPAGVVFQSPLSFMATITPMPAEAVLAVVDAMVHDGVELPGVNGEAATAARFAGHWAERTKAAARPDQGQRIYEVDTVISAHPPAGGRLRPADQGDEAVLVRWFDAFHREATADLGRPVPTWAEVVDRRLRTGQLWLWDDEGPVAMAGLSEPVSGVVRVGPVYTPTERRNSGYASALVAGVSSGVRSRGQRCMLYTDLANPTSNSIYRALGYRAVAEALRYAFDS
jgi:predicted GNAT family acetyltransferase